MTDVTPTAWWTMPETELKEMLERAQAGESIDDILIQAYLEGDHEYYDADAGVFRDELGEVIDEDGSEPSDSGA